MSTRVAIRGFGRAGRAGRATGPRVDVLLAAVSAMAARGGPLEARYGLGQALCPTRPTLLGLAF